MHLALSSFALLLPALLGNVAFAAPACQEKDNQIFLQDKGDQVFLQDEGEWNLTGFALIGCGGTNTTHTGKDDQGCKHINSGVPALSFRYDGIQKFKVCLFGDADCSLYLFSTPGDKDQTCHSLPVESFAVVNITQSCPHKVSDNQVLLDSPIDIVSRLAMNTATLFLGFDLRFLAICVEKESWISYSSVTWLRQSWRWLFYFSFRKEGLRPTVYTILSSR